MAQIRERPWRRWLNIAFRSLHLAGVALAAATITGTGEHPFAGIALMLVTGFVLYALELWKHPGLWKELAGVFIHVKLLLLLAMLLLPVVAAPLFWLLLVSSSVVAHAPRAFRHSRLIA